MSDEIVIPTGRMRAFARASLTMVGDTRPCANWLDDALDEVRLTTDPAFRPPIFGDGSDVLRWCEAVRELDAWVEEVADRFEEMDDPGFLAEYLLLAATGTPDLPPVEGLGGLFASLGLVTDQTVEEFDQIRTDLAGRPEVLGAWLDSLSHDQRTALFERRWAVLIAMDGLSVSRRQAVEAAARANVPRFRAWEQVAQEYGWGFLSIGTELRVERLVEYDGDVFLTIELSDSLTGKLDESLTGKLVEIGYGAETAYRLTMQFESMDELERTLDHIDEAFLPGPPDMPTWLPGPRQSIEFSAQTELELAARLKDHRDHIVGETRSWGTTAEIEVLNGLFDGDAVRHVGTDRNTGNTLVSGEVRAGVSAGTVLPDQVLISAGGVEVEAQDTVELSPDGEVVSRRRTTTFSAEAGAVALDTPRGGVEFGTDHGTRVVHTASEDADGQEAEMLVLADTEIERFGFSLAPDPRYPRAAMSYEAGEAVTTHVYVRGADGAWQEVTE